MPHCCFVTIVHLLADQGLVCCRVCVIIYGIFFQCLVCRSISVLNNGVVACSVGDDQVPTYKDTCSFTCNTGYELTGGDNRTCQSDGSWSGSKTICLRGKLNDGVCRIIAYNLNYLTIVSTTTA